MRRLLLALLLLPGAAIAVPSLSSDLGPALGQMRALTDANNHQGALGALAPVLAKTKPDSYDRYVLLQIQGRLHIAQNQFVQALAPLEASDALGQAHPDYVDPQTLPESLQVLAQLSYQVAADLKTTAAKAAGYRRALAYAQRWRALLARPDGNAIYFLASLRYALATLDTGHPDVAGLNAALADAREGLLTSLTPPDQLRLLSIAILQQLDRTTETVPQLELLVSRQPDNAGLWRQLAATYLTLAEQTKDKTWNLRAILALERAQQRGLLTDSQSRLNLVHAYLQVDGHEHTDRLLAAGLEDGSIESTARHWQFLATLRQEHGKPAKAIDTLREATRRFPADTNLALEFARQLHAAGQTAEAYRVATAAAAKPETMPNPGRALTYLAYLAYELDDRPAALRHLDAALAFPDAKPDDLVRLRAVLQQP